MARAIIRNNVFRNNQIMNGGAIAFDLNCASCAGSVIEGNVFEDNRGGHTGGIYSRNGDGPITIQGNTFTAHAGQYTIFFEGTLLVLENNRFHDNASSVACVSFASASSASSASGNVIDGDTGHGIVADGGTVTGNTVVDCITGISVLNGSASHNIAYQNETGIVCDGASSITCNDAFESAVANYDTSLCAGQTASNFALDPLFCAPASGDYTLASESPCAPAQSGGCGLIGALPVNCTATGVASGGRAKNATWTDVKSLFR